MALVATVHCTGCKTERTFVVRPRTALAAHVGDPDFKIDNFKLACGHKARVSGADVTTD